MPVSEVQGDAAIEPDHVYVAPGRRATVAIQGDVLRLVPRITSGSGTCRSILPRPLAQDQEAEAIAVSCPGRLGRDAGPKAIKAEGGIIFAQDGIRPARRHAAQHHRLEVRGLVLPAHAFAQALTAKPPSLVVITATAD